MVTAYIIGGYPAAGKSTALEAADEQGLFTVEMGDVVRQAYQKQQEDGSIDDDSLGDWASRQRRERDRGYFSRYTIAYIQRNKDPEEDVVISGIRSKEGLAEFIGYFDDIITIGIQCPAEVRHERMMERDDVDKEYCIRRDEREREWGTERFLDQHATYIIRNENCTEDRLKAKVNMIYDSP